MLSLNVYNISIANCEQWYILFCIFSQLLLNKLE